MRCAAARTSHNDDGISLDNTTTNGDDINRGDEEEDDEEVENMSETIVTSYYEPKEKLPFAIGLPERIPSSTAKMSKKTPQQHHRRCFGNRG